MTLNEAIEHAMEVSRRENLCLECRMDHEQLAKWLIELRIRRQADKKPSDFRTDHPECLRCLNRKTRIICLHCTRNPFAPSGGDKKQDYFNQEVDISIFEKGRK